jgi:Subtilase family/Ig-like domain CHU_C associated
MRRRSFVLWMLFVCLMAPAVYGQTCAELFGKTCADLPDKLGSTCDRMCSLFQRPTTEIRVIIGVDLDLSEGGLADWRPEGELSSGAIEVQRKRIANTKDTVVAAVQGVAGVVLTRMPERDYATIPYFVAHINAKAFAELVKTPAVASVEEPRHFVHALADTTGKIGATTVHARGVRGVNQTVVILDSGVEKTHPFLRGRILTHHEACFSSDYDVAGNQYKYETSCVPAATPDKPFGTADPCPSTSTGLNCGHGTRVAGVAAGSNSSFTGVAPAAWILPIKIMSKRYLRGTNTVEPVVQLDDMVAALEYVAALAGTPEFRREVQTVSGVQRRNRLAVNISQTMKISQSHPNLGSVEYAKSRLPCNDHSPSLRDSVRALAALDVPVIAATGNDKQNDGLLLPACIEGVIAVSATTNEDAVPDYANVAHKMDLFAPGGADVPPGTVPQNGPHIETSDLDGVYASDAGTSLAAPHVAGAFALLREADPFASFQQLLERLAATGRNVTDQRSGTQNVMKPRINVADALNACDYRLSGAVAKSLDEARQVTLQPADTIGARTFWIDPPEQAHLVVELSNTVDGTETWHYAPELIPVETTLRRRIFAVPRFTGTKTILVTVEFTNTKNGHTYTCSRTIAFTVIGSDVPPFSLKGGMCQPVDNPILFVRVGDKIKLNTMLLDESGSEITDLEKATYVWTIDGASSPLLRGIGSYYRELTHIIESPAPIYVTVTKDGFSSKLTFTPLMDPRPRPPGIYERTCKMRSIKKAGQAVSSYTFADGETATFEVPELIAGATYEWRSRTDAGSDEFVGSGATLTTGALPGGRLYVLTTTSNGSVLESDELLLVSNAGSSSRITITPAYQSIPGAGTARITASFVPETGMDASYEWRKDNSYDTSSLVIHHGPTLTLVGEPVGGVYWCRVIETKPGYEKHYYSRFASVNVHCSPTISGSIVATPFRVAKHQAPQLWAKTDARQASHQWYRFLPGQTPTAMGSDWFVQYPQVNAPETRFRVQVTDSCGTTRTLSDVSVFLCVPTILTQPAPNTVAATPPKLTVSVEPAIAGQPFTVTWHKTTDPNGTVTLATGPELTPEQSAGTTQSYYAAIKTTSCGSSTPHTIKSNAATVEICAPPVITSHTPLKETKGEAAILLVSATGTDLTYQWYRGDSGVTTYPLAGKTDPSLSIAPSVTTNYWVQVKSRGVCNALPSPTMTIKVCALPVINTAPQSTRVFPNKTATLTVSATNPAKNSDPLQYAWSQGTTAISGATASTYTTPPITAATTFSVKVSSGICQTTSASATVSLCSYPEVLNLTTSSFSIASGGTATLSLPALSPALPKTVNWYRGAAGDKTNRVSSGPDITAYTTPPLTATTQYWAEVDENGCVSRTPAYTVNVCKPAITAQPQNATVAPNTQHQLSVTATPSSGLTYQWYRGDAGVTTDPVAGATSSSYTTPALAATATYWVRVTGCTSVNSTAATITVCNPPAVTSIAKIAGDAYNSTGEVTVTATGTGLTYQWYRGQSGDVSQPISGATSATYTFIRKQSEYYWARVRSSCTTAVANSLAIFVTVDPVITAHPQSVTIPSGGTATLSVAASGTYLTYQWYQGSSTVITGATNATYTTPALTTATSYWCRVTSGGLSVADTSAATVSICAGPDINSFGSTSVGENSWRLTVNMAAPPDASVGYVYHWYSGTRGNPAQSIDLGEGSYYRTFYDLAQPTTYWVRVWWDDNSCYTDTAAKTLTPQ